MSNLGISLYTLKKKKDTIGQNPAQLIPVNYKILKRILKNGGGGGGYIQEQLLLYK